MDESVLRNVDTQHRRLAEVEAALDALRHGDTDPSSAISPRSNPDGGLSYDALTARNDALRADEGWHDIDLGAALDPIRRAQFDRWRQRQRLPWKVSDVLAVGLAGVLGLAATVYDDEVDAAVREGLGRLKDTEVLTGWERDARGLAIDYTGQGFGGPDHRARSAGHDLARPLAALAQIKAGRIEGVEWVDGVRHAVSANAGRQVAGSGEAFVLWAKHLAADVVTPMSLPLPGWSLLREVPSRRVRTLAAELYRGTQWGEGLNLRSGAITPTLPVLTTEIIIRSHVHARVWAATGSPTLNLAQQALRAELLLAGHALVGAASLAATTARVLAGPGGALNPTNLLELRHLNVPVLLRAGAMTLQVTSDVRARRAAAAPTWDDLLSGVAQPWQLDEAAAIEHVASTGDTAG